MVTAGLDLAASCIRNDIGEEQDTGSLGHDLLFMLGVRYDVRLPNGALDVKEIENCIRSMLKKPLSDLSIDANGLAQVRVVPG
jgi:hypothetical protein